jgi:16S rRNA processing protein RimM
VPQLKPDNESRWVIVGRFGRVHGIKGDISIISFTEPRDNILNYSNWHAYIHHEWHPIHLVHIDAHHKSILARVEGYEGREEVAQLTNVDIAILQEQLPSLEDGEYYWHQLNGMQVLTQDNKLLGIVKELLPTGANDVLVVVGEKRHLIPYLPGRTVINVDAKEKTMIVDWDLDF